MSASPVALSIRHPYVRTAMDEFLKRLADPAFRSIYDGLDDIWD